MNRIDIQLPTNEPAAHQRRGFRMGSGTGPSGHTIDADGASLLYNGRAWTPVMGEIHYSRVDPSRWRDELLKMRAGGIDIVATYVFWIHHEEDEGDFDWTGGRNLRRFAELCDEVGLTMIARLGPWCHGEVRHGGIPDWAVARFGKRLRTDDAAYLASVRKLFEQCFAQLRGQLWKDGGPVIGVQIENEYGGPAEHLLTLKRIAQAVGFDVPLYTRTGWPQLQTPMPFGELLPLHGAYVEGFWDRSIESMPGTYYQAFCFIEQRDDAAIATDHFGTRAAGDSADTRRYPYLTCELGGGMMSSYHRRIAIDPRDIESAALVKLGSGSALLGYYMYHGGTNPSGRHTTMHEQQATTFTNYNDLPTINYDFQAPLGAFGQVRPHYGLLRRLHTFIHDVGASLSAMTTLFPEPVTSRDDTRALRWSARTDGRGGYLFINNYQRSLSMPQQRDVQFRICGPDDAALLVPERPVDVPADTCFVWAFNRELGAGVALLYATARPLCTVAHAGISYAFFAAIPDIAAEFVFDRAIAVESAEATVTRLGSERWKASDVRAGRGCAIRVQGPDHSQPMIIVLLSDADSRRLTRVSIGGVDSIVLADAAVAADGEVLRLWPQAARDEEEISVFPPRPLRIDGQLLRAEQDGVFATTSCRTGGRRTAVAGITQTLDARGVREIAVGSAGVAEAPVDADFAEHAAVWQIDLPNDVDLSDDWIARIDYIGDAARVYVGDVCVIDDFWNGKPLEFDIARHEKRLARGETMSVRVLPLQRDAAIFLPPSGHERSAGVTCAVESVRLERSLSLALTVDADGKETAAGPGGVSSPSAQQDS